jgi:hypothetical protein
MMKHIIFTGTLLLAGVMSEEAMALCDGTGSYPTAVTDATTLFSGKTICATADGSGEKWHEYHNPTGNVLEKIGDGTVVDPNVPVGTWGTTNDGPPAHVSYTYTGDAGSPYSYFVYTDGGSGVELCGLIRATGTLAPGKSGPGC